MKPRTALLLDCETSGLDPQNDHLLEVGVIRYSVEHATILTAASWLVRAPSNAAEHVNGIPLAILGEGQERELVMPRLRRWADACDAIIAHNAAFDSAWLPDLGKPWICSCDDVEWPGRSRAGALEPTRERPGQSLVALCLAHGVGVASAHRALTDCFLLAALLGRVAELGHDVGAMLERGMRPKVRVVAQVTFDNNHLAKAASFRWDPAAKVWWRNMFVDEVAALPFKTRVATETRRAG